MYNMEGGEYVKNPNGFGTVTKLSGKRRKPWIVKVTIGYDEKTGKQLQKAIGTFESRPEAIKYLSLYNISKDNHDIALNLNYNQISLSGSHSKNKHSFLKCAEELIERDKPHRSNQWFRSKQSALNLLSDIHDKNIEDLDFYTIQKVFDNLKNNKLSDSTLKNCKRICTTVFEEAVINKWINQNDDYTKYIKTKSIAERKIIHYPLSKEERSIVINDDSFESKVILVYILTGCRASELLDVKKFDDYIVCGLKTENGKNRKIPIHYYIEPFIDEVLQYLSDKSYVHIAELFAEYMNKYGMSHTMHDTRNTFATLGKENGMKPTAIKKIMGHKIKDLTDDVYTHESIEYLKNEVDKIKIP